MTPYGLTFKVDHFKEVGTSRDLVRIQAYAKPQEDEGEGRAADQPELSSVPFSLPDVPALPSLTADEKKEVVAPVSPRPSVEDKIKKFLDRVVDIKTLTALEEGYSLYNDLVIKADGVSWAFGGLAFVLDWQWNVLTTGAANFDMAVNVCTKGKVGLDNVSVKQFSAKGQDVIVRGAGSIGRLDVWATGEKDKQGAFRITEGSDEQIGQLYLHQGKGENQGHLTIQESLNQTEAFDNQGILSLGKDAFLKVGRVFSNYGEVGGEAYTLQSTVVRNQSVEDKKATIKATQKLTIESEKMEQKGSITAPLVDLSKVREIEGDTASVIKADQLKTALKKSWVSQGTVETEEWQDESGDDVSIQNKGTFISRKKTTVKARYRTAKDSKTDFSGVDFKNTKDAYQTLVNEGDMVLRKVQSLGGYHKDIDNKQGARLTFLDCGYSSSYARDKNGVPQWGGLHMGKVTNAGTIGFGRGTYRTHGVLTNAETGVHEVLDGQELWMKDLINDGVIKASGTYRIGQRLGVFTKLGKVLVGGKLITQISERAIRHKTGGTTWKHTGHIEADDWVDESDATVKIENEGTIITRKSTTLRAQFETGKGGFSDLTGLSLSQSLYSHQVWANKGKTILRKVQSLGDLRRSILNEKDGKLAFLEGDYSRVKGNAETGGFKMGDITNYGTISFGGGEYYTGIFTNHSIHEALAGQWLWAADFINHGETRSDKGYRVDMTRGTFTKLGRMVIKGGNLIIQFSQGTNAGQYLTNNNVQNWIIEGGDLRVEAPYFHNAADLGLNVPFYLWVNTFLNDAAIHTYGFTLRAQIFGQGTLGGRLGDIKSSGRVDIEVEGDVDNRRGRLEAAEEGEVTSKKGDITIGQGVGYGYRQKNGAFIHSDKSLRLNSRNIVASFGQIGSKGPLKP